MSRRCNGRAARAHLSTCACIRTRRCNVLCAGSADNTPTLASMWRQLSCQKAAAQSLSARCADAAKMMTHSAAPLKNMQRILEISCSSKKKRRWFGCHQTAVFSLPFLEVCIKTVYNNKTWQRICIHLMAAKSLPLFSRQTRNFRNALQPRCEFVKKCCRLMATLRCHMSAEFRRLRAARRSSRQHCPCHRDDAAVHVYGAPWLYAHVCDGECACAGWCGHAWSVEITSAWRAFVFVADHSHIRVLLARAHMQMDARQWQRIL